jgi:hypothetical protein
VDAPVAVIDSADDLPGAINSFLGGSASDALPDIIESAHDEPAIIESGDALPPIIDSANDLAGARDSDDDLAVVITSFPDGTAADALAAIIEWAEDRPLIIGSADNDSEPGVFPANPALAFDLDVDGYAAEDPEMGGFPDDPALAFDFEV